MDRRLLRGQHTAYFTEPLIAQELVPGAVLINRKTKSGRSWQIRSVIESTIRVQGRSGLKERVTSRRVYLFPRGKDVRPAMNPETHRWQGGVRGIERTQEQLLNGNWELALPLPTTVPF